jgi:arginyl-tRNA synthetase
VLPHKQIELKLQAAVREILPEADVSAVLVRPCDPKFGDYQSNALMSLAKARKLNPRQIAENVLAKLDVSDVCEKVEIAGAGFLNFRLKNSVLTQSLESAARGEHLFFEKTVTPKTVVVDFSSPNVAKPMHVGHVRSTILGDSLARVLDKLGHKVIRDNHIGDWGTQFGMLIYGWKKILDPAALEASPIDELVRLYRKVTEQIQVEKKQLEEDAWKKTPNAIAVYIPDSPTEIECRRELVLLQRGWPENVEIWKQCVAYSWREFEAIYRRLKVEFNETLGESFYNDKLAPLVDELIQEGIARESEGAIAIFFDEYPQLKDKPLIIRKSDGGFNYATTDLATIAYRLEKWNPDEIIYVTDGRQQLHFQQVFFAFHKWRRSVGPKRWRNLRIDLAHISNKNPTPHVWFGSILGEDGKPFKTRSGETVKLADLLDEAEERAFKIVSKKNSELPEAQQLGIARVVGIGAVKYADLLPNRQSDYVFSWDKMLALTGNTSPYLQYAYARIKSIFRKLENPESRTQNPELKLDAPEEIALAKHLLNFGLTLEAVAEEYRPNFLCNYLFELAGKFTGFYENCPVLKAEGAVRESRLALCDLTARVLKQGLDVLGIEVVEQM